MSTDLIIYLSLGASDDASHLATANANLREAIRELDGIRSVKPLPIGNAPTGAKAGDLVSASAILVSLIGSGGMLSSLLGLLQHWVNRNNQRRFELVLGPHTLKMEGCSPEQQEQAFKVFLDTVKNTSA